MDLVLFLFGFVIFILILLFILVLIRWNKNCDCDTNTDVSFPNEYLQHHNVTIVTAYSKDREHTQYTSRINRAYAQFNGYQYKEVILDKRIYPERNYPWSKIKVLLDELNDGDSALNDGDKVNNANNNSETLANKDNDYIMWIDDDAAFVNFSLNLSPLIYLSDNSSFIFSRDMSPASPINAGVFLFRRNDPYVRNILERLHDGSEFKEYFTTDLAEQDAMSKIILQPDITCTKDLFNGTYEKTLKAGYPIVRKQYTIFNENNFNSHNNHFIKHLAGIPNNVRTKVFKDLSDKLESSGTISNNISRGTIWSTSHSIVPKVYSNDKDNKYSNTLRGIPLAINQSFNSVLLPKSISECVRRTLIINHNFEYQLHTDNDNSDFIKNNYKDKYYESYLKLNPGAFRSDLWRYLYLYKKGGFYTDIKTYPLANFTTLLSQCNNKNVDANSEEKKNSVELILVEDPRGKGYWNAFMACKPGNKLMKACYRKCHDNIVNEKYGDSDLDITGPTLLGRCVKDRYGELKIGYNHTIDGPVLVLARNYEGPFVHQVYLPNTDTTSNDKTKVPFLLTRRPNFDPNVDTKDMLLATTKPHYQEYYRNKNVYKQDAHK